MIRYVLCLPNLHGSFATSIYFILIECAKLQNLIAEPVFFRILGVAISKVLPVTTQTFVIFVYKIKHIEAEKYDLMPEHRSCFEAKM